MNIAADPTFIAAEVAYRFERDRVTASRPSTHRRTLRDLLIRILPDRLSRTRSDRPRVGADPICDEVRPPAHGSTAA